MNKIREKNRNLNPIIKTNTNIKNTKVGSSISQTKNGKTEYYTIQLSSFEDKKAAEKLAKAFGKDINDLIKIKYKVSGTWDDPVIKIIDKRKGVLDDIEDLFK